MKNILLMRKCIFSFILLCYFFYGQAQKIAITAYTPGLTSPIAVTNGGDDRLFVAERAGKVRVINPDGTLRATPFLDITAKIPSLDGEEGLLGLAMSSDFLTSGKFYVNYVTQTGGSTYSVIEEYKTSTSDPNVADPTPLTLLTQLQPAFTNHKGGNLMFGKDGYLYISLGDGGSGGDPFGNGQNTETFLAKVLRIDISNSSVAQPYAIPPGNPFALDPSTTIKKEIWAYGVRNPYRCSIDRITGDTWIADVGQSNWEEIDYEQYGEASRLPNYGWNILEGNHCYPPATTTCDFSGKKLPIYEYDHTVGQSIIGGYVYRSAQSKALFGTYLYADYVQKWIDGFTQQGGVATVPVTRFLDGAQDVGNPISFGEDRYGDQYIIFNSNATIYKISDSSYIRRPKAYLLSTTQSATDFSLTGLQGVSLTYKWLLNGTAIAGATNATFSGTAAGTYKLVVTNTLGFNDTSDAFVFGALPLTLKIFSAQRQSAKAVQLLWQTQIEENISSFTIQRKINGQPDFITIGSLPGKGSAADYNFTDTSASSESKLFYRIKINNKDGSSILSDIKLINAINVIKGYSIYPNPAKNFITIELSNYTSPLQLILYDRLGRKVMQQKLSQRLNTISLHSLKGIYTVSLVSEDGKSISRERIVVE